MEWEREKSLRGFPFRNPSLYCFAGFCYFNTFAAAARGATANFRHSLSNDLWLRRRRSLEKEEDLAVLLEERGDTGRHVCGEKRITEN